MPEELKEEIRLSRIIKRYGGWRAVLSSWFFRIALLLLLPTYSLWSKPNWWDTVMAVIPNLLGFTIGAFALTLAFGDERFKNLLANSADDESGSTIHEMSATFFIFIAVQSIALLSAIACKGMWEFGSSIVPENFFGVIQIFGNVIWCISYLFFIYGIVLALAAAKWIHMLAIVYAQHLKGSKN